MHRGQGFSIAALVLGVLLAGGSADGKRERRPIDLVSVEDVVLATMLLAGNGPKHPVLLFDERDRDALTAYAATWAGPIRCFQRPTTRSTVVASMKATAGGPCTVVEEPLLFARTLWPEARAAVAAPSSDYSWLLQAAAFAGNTGSALLPVDTAIARPSNWLGDWQLETLYLPRAAQAWKTTVEASVSNVIEVATAEELATEQLRLSNDAPVRTVVISNPSDRLGIFSPSTLSLLAPLVSVVRNAPLLLSNASDPAIVEEGTRKFIDAHQLHPSHIILVGDELALRSHRIPDPVREAGGPEARGGGIEVRVELFSEIQREQPQDFAVGRIVAESAAQASVVLARQLHSRKRSRRQPVVFLANADEIFALGETISRTTAKEVRNVGIGVRAYYREAITVDVIQRALKETDVLVWEGHPRDLTLEEHGGIAVETAPRLVVLQGCYTLDRSDPFILLEKGTEAIVATSAAIYSASGSAFVRALFDALLYERADLGVAVRDARNYLLALAKLKRLRGHGDWRKTYRAALAFTLWGDPTTRAPLQPGPPARTPARWEQKDAGLSLTVPRGRLGEVTVGRYRARVVSRAMLGGLLLRHGDKGDQRYLKELYFTAEHAPAGVSVACSPGKGWDVVSLYAPRTKTLSVLARPDWKRMKASKERGNFLFSLAADAAECELSGSQDPGEGGTSGGRDRSNPS